MHARRRHHTCTACQHVSCIDLRICVTLWEIGNSMQGTIECVLAEEWLVLPSNALYTCTCNLSIAAIWITCTFQKIFSSVQLVPSYVVKWICTYCFSLSLCYIIFACYIYCLLYSSYVYYSNTAAIFLLIKILSYIHFGLFTNNHIHINSIPMLHYLVILCLLWVWWYMRTPIYFVV